MASEAHLALYGNVKMIRAFCDECCGYALVVRGLLACCDRPYRDETPKQTKRMTHPEQIRRLPPINERRQALVAQDYRCIYCYRQFGAHVMRGLRITRLRICWDHVVPFVRTQDNRPCNFVASCQVCNGIKADHCYQTIEEARIAIQEKREAKGYKDL